MCRFPISFQVAVPPARRQTPTAAFVAPQEDFAAAAGDHGGFREA